MDWNELEALCARINGRKRSAGAITNNLETHAADLKLALAEIMELKKAGQRPPPASTHPNLAEVSAEFAWGFDTVMDGRIVTWDDVEKRAERLWDMKQAGTGIPDNPEFVKATAHMLDGIKAQTTPMPPVETHPFVEWADRHMQALRNQDAKASRKARKERVTDSVVSLLKHLSREHANRRVIASVAAAEKIVITSADDLLLDLMPHVGVTDHHHATCENYAAIALARFRERGAVPMPFSPLVIILRMEAEPELEMQGDGPVTIVLLVTASEHLLHCQGWLNGHDQRFWAGPYDFKIMIAVDPPLLMRETRLADGGRKMYQICMTVLLAAALPHTRGQAPGERPSMTPSVSGRPVMASKFRTVELLPPPAPVEPVPRGPVGERHAPAYHSVKEHDRTYKKTGKTIRVKAHHRGDAGGLINKVYVH